MNRRRFVDLSGAQPLTGTQAADTRRAACLVGADKPLHKPLQVKPPGAWSIETPRVKRRRFRAVVSFADACVSVTTLERWLLNTALDPEVRAYYLRRLRLWRRRCVTAFNRAWRAQARRILKELGATGRLRAPKTPKVTRERVKRRPMAAQPVQRTALQVEAERIARASQAPRARRGLAGAASALRLAADNGLTED